MTSTMATRVAAFAVAAFGLAWGGPQRMPVTSETAVVGADPVALLANNCNGNDTARTSCPLKGSDGDPCKTANFNKIKTESSGTEVTKYYENITEMCAKRDNGCERYDVQNKLSSCTRKNVIVDEEVAEGQALSKSPK